MQKRLQQEDKAAGKNVQSNKNSRWNRECQRRGCTPQMWHLLSFAGCWDPHFLEGAPVPTLEGELTQEQKIKRRAFVVASAKFRLSRKHKQLSKSTGGFTFTRAALYDLEPPDLDKDYQ